MGLASGSPLTTLPRTLTIEDTSGTQNSYEFTVSGGAELQSDDS
jgi:hypothetical protein